MYLYIILLINFEFIQFHLLIFYFRNLATPVRPVQTSNTSLETYTPTPTTLHKESCHRLDYLVERQKQLCMLSDKMVQVRNNK